MSAATQNEMERLRQERDALQEQLSAALEREAALVAHVERLRKAALDAIHYLPGGEIKAELRDAYDDTPETSLANLKAEWDQDELQPIWETLIKVADMLGIDPEKARRAGGKQSETYAAHLTRSDLIKQAEALELVNCQSGPQEDTPQEDAFDAGWDAAFELIRQFASELRQRAQELTP